MKKIALLIAVTLSLAGCGNVSVENYAANQPKFNPEQFFNGPLRAEGIVLSRSGELQRYFTADIESTWNQSSGSLKETFYWNDGEQQKRHWKFNRLEDGSWQGTAEDVEGMAKMRFDGNAIHMRYPLLLSMGERTITVTMDDWMFQVSDDVIINKTGISKFGFRLGEVFLTIRKP